MVHGGRYNQHVCFFKSYSLNFELFFNVVMQPIDQPNSLPDKFRHVWRDWAHLATLNQQ